MLCFHCHNNHVLFLLLSCSCYVFFAIMIMLLLLCDVVGPDYSVVHAYDTGQLQAIPQVVGPRLSHGKLTRRAVTTMGSIDLVIGEDHLLGPSCQLENWQMRLDSLWQLTQERENSDFKPQLSC